MSTIVQEGAEVLRDTAEPVPETLFGTPELEKMLTDMAEALDGELDGVALAAPQIGLPYRMFVVRYDRLTPPTPDEEPKREPELGIYINPKIIKTSRRRVEVDEGCLSVRGTYGHTLRHERATVQAQRADGSTFTRGGGGILAQVFQHETDHLDGILFIDHALDLYDIRPDDQHAPQA